MDPVPLLVDLTSLLALVIVLVIGSKAIRAFRDSKQAVAESASILDLIVAGLTSRVDRSESIVNEVRAGVDKFRHQNETLENEQTSLRTSYMQLLRYLQEIMANDKRMILELEHVKSGLASLQKTSPQPTQLLQERRQTPPLTDGDILASLTPTERHTLEILSREGPKAAPELGRRLRKTREHTARLMKNLYLEGYVDRETNHAPFRYKLNEKVLASLEAEKQRTVSPQA